MDFVAMVWILALGSAGLGWLLQRASESKALKAVSWFLYGLSFLIGTGGVAIAMDAANNPSKYGGP
jgi:hypothetical protein